MLRCCHPKAPPTCQIMEVPLDPFNEQLRLKNQQSIRKNSHWKPREKKNLKATVSGSETPIITVEKKLIEYNSETYYEHVKMK